MRAANARSILAAAALCLAPACSDDSVTGPATPPDLGSAPSTEAHRLPDPDIAVMTRNMYVGADVDAVIAALVTPDPADDQAALVAAIGTLQEVFQVDGHQITGTDGGRRIWRLFALPETDKRSLT